MKNIQPNEQVCTTAADKVEVVRDFIRGLIVCARSSQGDPLGEAMLRMTGNVLASRSDLELLNCVECGQRSKGTVA